MWHSRSQCHSLDSLLFICPSRNPYPPLSPSQYAIPQPLTSELLPYVFLFDEYAERRSSAAITMQAASPPPLAGGHSTGKPTLDSLRHAPLTVWAPARTQAVVQALKKCGVGSLPAALNVTDEWHLPAVMTLSLVPLCTAMRACPTSWLVGMTAPWAYK